MYVCIHIYNAQLYLYKIYVSIRMCIWIHKINIYFLSFRLIGTNYKIDWSYFHIMFANSQNKTGLL